MLSRRSATRSLGEASIERILSAPMISTLNGNDRLCWVCLVMPAVDEAGGGRCPSVGLLGSQRGGNFQSED